MIKKFCRNCGGDLQKKVDEGRQRDYCKACDKLFYDNPIPATAGALIEDGKILLVKRGIEPGKGRWCLPGGFLEIDEDPVTGCLREVSEETGLDCSINKLLKVGLSPNPVYQSVLLIGYLLKDAKGEPEAGDDSVDYGYFTLDNLPDVAFKSHLEIIKMAFAEENPKRLPEEEFGAYVITSGNHARIAEEACKGGASVIQYRDKEGSRKELLENSFKIREITSKYGALFIVNDYIDIALLTEADGVHLGQDDIPLPEARKIVPESFIIGISTHSLEQALKACGEGADYIGIGPVFKTPTKKDYINIGVETVKDVAGQVDIPFVAIGGLNLENMGALDGIGVKNIAMVREFQEHTTFKIKELNERLKTRK